MTADDTSLGTVLTGIGVSPGIVTGYAVFIDAHDVPVECVQLASPQAVEDQVLRLQSAVELAEAEIDAIHASLSEHGGPAGDHLAVLDAHKLMLRDPLLISDAIRRIQTEQVNAEWALSRAVARVSEIFDELEDPFFRARGADVTGVGQLLMRCLAGGRASAGVHDVAPGAVVVAHALTPSDALSLARQRVGGFVLDSGAPTSHTAIIARSMGIPAVVGVGDACGYVGKGDRLIVDGDEGEVVVHPSAAEELIYLGRASRAQALQLALHRGRGQPSVTRDGTLVALRGNLDFAADVHRLTEHGAAGVGLFRTEFLFMDRETLPSEEEQFEVYAAVVRHVAPEPATLRTLDIGGDKVLPFESQAAPRSPGLRAVRYCLRHTELFRTQLRAMFRASAHGSVRLLVPFVTTMAEVLTVRRLMTQVREELAAEGHAMAADVPLGFMIEVPGAALIADEIARHADFLSVGSNDLIQYTLAVSREDEALEHLYQPLHPAILRLLAMVTSAARQAGVPVSICGEMAGDPSYTLILLALGFGELSMNARAIPMVKQVVRRSDRAQAAALYDRVAPLWHADEIKDTVESYMVEHFGDLITPRWHRAPHFVR